MATLAFDGITEELFEQLEALFEVIKTSKAKEEFDDAQIMEMLGERFNTKFWWPTDQERADWANLWKATSVEKRLTDPRFVTEWEFESWIEALENADITYVDLILDGSGKGKIIYEQLSFPSGGIEAIQHIVKIFDGNVVSCDAI